MTDCIFKLRNELYDDVKLKINKEKIWQIGDSTTSNVNERLRMRYLFSNQTINSLQEVV